MVFNYFQGSFDMKTIIRIFFFMIVEMAVVELILKVTLILIILLNSIVFSWREQMRESAHITTQNKFSTFH